MRYTICFSRFSDKYLNKLEAVCKNDNITSMYYLLDTLRKKFLIGYCPEVEPIPRCFISEAEERLNGFMAYFGIGASEEVCRYVVLF